MARTVGIGNQDFESIRTSGYFYIDKTGFIREWWENGDSVTLITRPRRFGKTLNMSMTECFFSIKYAGRGDLFEGLSIWREEKYRKLQGSWPVIFFSFADVKETSYEQARKKICRIIRELYRQFDFLLKTDMMNENEKNDFTNISADMEDNEAAFALRTLSGHLFRYYGKKVIILLDEYDTPMQEAFVNGYWEELVGFTRSLFNSTFKTNPYLERAIMTGITRVSKESIFSDLNNLKVITVTAENYADSFGFTEEEVFGALDEFGLCARKEDVKKWYDGFTFGNQTDIYNPWSIISFLDEKKLRCYWANTSSNGLVSTVIREGNSSIKQSFERLLSGEHLTVSVDEQFVYSHMVENENAVWSLLLASGYLKVCGYREYEDGDWDFPEDRYELGITNLEVELMFRRMVDGWFRRDSGDYEGFIRSLREGNVKNMNLYMNRITLETFSYFDTGKDPAREEPERFYHGFVLGLLVTLRKNYILTSNRESGFGRYDVMLEPRAISGAGRNYANSMQEGTVANNSIRIDAGTNSSTGNAVGGAAVTNSSTKDEAIIIEFKVQESDDEAELSDTVEAALRQIREKNYEASLIARGIPKERIRKYGFAFCGKKVLIGQEMKADL